VKKLAWWFLTRNCLREKSRWFLQEWPVMVWRILQKIVLTKNLPGDYKMTALYWRERWLIPLMEKWGVQLEKLFNWRGYLIGEVIQLERSFNWRGHSIGEVIQLGRSLY